MLYVGEGPRGSKGARYVLHQILATPSATHNQIGPLWCWFPSGWACACSRPLWVSPTTSPVRLGVSPAAAPTPTGIFNQNFEVLFPQAGALGCAVCFAPSQFVRVIYTRMWGPVLRPHHSESGPLGLSVCECGSAGSASGQTACHIGTTLRQSRPARATGVLSASAARLHPSYWSGWMFLFYPLGVGLPWFDFLSVLVVRGGTLYLPMPPSSFSPAWIFFTLSIETC